MSEEGAPTPAQNPMGQLFANPWALVILAILGGGSVGTATDFIPGFGDSSEGVSVTSFNDYVRQNNAVLSDIQRDVIELRTARDEQHEVDHFYVGCLSGRMDCSAFKNPEGDDADDND